MPRLPLEHRYTAGLLLLTVSTGAIDAVSYLALDRVFTGNMTGNVLFIGFALVGVAGIPLLNNLVALAGFIIGSIVSGRVIGRGHPRGLPVTSAITLAVGAGLLVCLAVTLLLVTELPEWGLLLVTFVLASAMGAQVSAVKPIGNSDVTTIVVTNTVANLARDSTLGGGDNRGWMPRLLAIVAMGLGAAIGAGLVTQVGGGVALLAAAGIFALATGVLVATRARR
jgi:uncharacterized membrane protein YoaK (UPF0700 family)